jgi:hypothetical protein
MSARPDSTLTDEEGDEGAYDDEVEGPGDEAFADEPEDEGEQLEDAGAVDPAVLALIREVEQPNERVSFDLKRPPELPQPDRAKSVPNLPKVKSSAFRRILR